MSFQFFRQSRHLLLSGLIASIGLWAIPAQAQVSDAQVNALVEALRQAAPPNRPNDGMYSQWQVLPGIIPSWTKQCIGRELTAAQFESDATAARNTVACIVRREFNQRYKSGNEAAAVRATACWWMTGKDTACTGGATASYVQRVVGFYQQAGAGNRPAQPSATTQRQSATSQQSTTGASSSVTLVGDNQVAAMVDALRLAAPRTATPNDGLYSEWQVKAEIIPSWSKQCIGQELTPAQFESDATAARRIVSCIMQRELNRQYSASNGDETTAVRRTACWWMTGNAEGCNSGATADYVQKVASLYQQQARANPSSNQQAATTQTSTQRPAATEPLVSITEVSDSQVAALVEAMRLAVADTPKPTGLYSEWQVKPEIIPSWTKQCVGRELTPAEFDSDAQAARATVTCIMRRELSRQYRDTINNEPLAVKRVASWWLTGDPNSYSSDPTASYSQKILALYQQQRSETSSQR